MISHYWAVVPAAGNGSRMRADRPKQYLELGGKTVLEHTLTRLAAIPEIKGIVVCVAKEDPYWDALSLPAKVHRATGGAERCHSVLNGLKAIQAQPDDWVLVHDAARPCVRISDIRRLMKELADHPVGGLLAASVRDTMKRAGADGMTVTETISRESLWHALTPQMFRCQALRAALEKALADEVSITDDAQAMEYSGLMPRLIHGHADNIKITHPQDLALAELYLAQQNPYSGN